MTAKHKTDWAVWLWLALGVYKLAMCCFQAGRGQWEDAYDDLVLAFADLYIGSLVYSLGKARHANKMALDVLGPIAARMNQRGPR